MQADDRDLERRLRMYTADLPADTAKAWHLLKTYSNIPEEEIEPHVRAMVGSPPEAIRPFDYSD